MTYSLLPLLFTDTSRCLVLCSALVIAAFAITASFNLLQRSKSAGSKETAIGGAYERSVSCLLQSVAERLVLIIEHKQQDGESAIDGGWCAV